VNLLQHRSIISLIGNVQRSSLILEKVLYFLVQFNGDYLELYSLSMFDVLINHWDF